MGEPPNETGKAPGSGEKAESGDVFGSGDPEDWDEDASYGGTHILWGRVALLALLLVAVFFLGRQTAPDEGLERARRLETALRSERAVSDDLRAELSDPSASPSPTGSPSESPSASPSPDEETQDGGEGTRSYTVRSGDTLQAIAERFYGDTGLANFLARANDISNVEELAVGQELTIPPEP